MGDRFGGWPDLDNIVSQAKEVNLSAYRKIENEWASAIRRGEQMAVAAWISEYRREQHKAKGVCCDVCDRRRKS